MKISALMEENQRSKFRHKEELKDHELSSTREIQRLKEFSQTSEGTLKEQVTKLEAIRTGLERVSLIVRVSSIECCFFLLLAKEINALKSTLSTQKLNHDETLQQEKLRIKNEDEKIQHEFEDRLRAMTTNKEELEVREFLLRLSSIRLSL